LPEPFLASRILDAIVAPAGSTLRPISAVFVSCVVVLTIEAAVIEGAVHRLRPKLMTVCVVLASLIPILWETGVGADVMKPIAAPLVGGMITSTVHVLILVPVFFALMKGKAVKQGTLNLEQKVEANQR
jgi:Cu/Ag efflux pump CusA